MGAGHDLAGRSPAGEDLPVADALRAPVLPAAMAFDPFTRTFVIADDGAELLAMDPIDQKVALAIAFPVGTVPSAPLQGHTIALFLKTAREEERQHAAEFGVQDTFKEMVLAGEITIGDVTVDVPVRDNVSFDYTNNLTGKKNIPITVTSFR